MIQTIKLEIKGMHCVSCAMNIDGVLEESEGVAEANTSFAKQLVEVKYDPQKIDVNKIKDIIVSTGYQIK